MRKRVRLLCTLLSFGLSACAPFQTGQLESSHAPPARRVLTASLYPYIPDAGAAYFALEEAFERANPEIDLQVHLLGDTYYDHEAGGGGILEDEADVYEIDSLFLADFIERGKIAPLGREFAAEAATVVPFAQALAVQKGELYGLPHWLCGNFLFYRTDDEAIATAQTLLDIEGAIHGSTQEPRWLIADFFGRSTLGEMYLDAAMDADGSSEAALRRVMNPELDPELVAAMSRVVSLIRPEFGRDDDYHERIGFYARQFARGSGRAYVGYSEQLYYALSETTLSCRRDEQCLTSEQIGIAEWPLADEASHPIAWVDMLVIDADAAGQKRLDAERFIRFMATPETYRLLLLPTWPNPPRYLLPAREDMFTDAELVAAAPLYVQFRERIANATPITNVGLGERLRKAGEDLEKALPPR